MKYSASRTSRSPRLEASTRAASSASSAGGVSPIGEAVPRLPPSVAPLRISRDANCGHNWSSSGTRNPDPPSRASISDRLSAAPMSMLSRPTVSSRSSAIRSMPTLSAALVCLMFSSTPQSVDPATSWASGSAASSASASVRSAGRT